jgi:hypothetical protein
VNLREKRIKTNESARDQMDKSAVVSKRYAAFRMLFYFYVGVECVELVERVGIYSSALNSSHADWFYRPIPQWMIPTGYVAAALLCTCALFCGLCVGDVGTWFSSKAVFILYSYLYFSNRTDSYQHHYLTCVLLFFPALHGPEDFDRTLMFLRLEMAIVYLYTTVTKLERSFLTGNLLMRQLMQLPFHDAVHQVYLITGYSEQSVWTYAAIAVVSTEALLCLLWFLGVRSWWFVLLGVGFHASIELADFKILRFSWLMIAMYLALATPDGSRFHSVFDCNKERYVPDRNKRLD